jgi:hypothetical protein
VRTAGWLVAVLAVGCGTTDRTEVDTDDTEVVGDTDVASTGQFAAIQRQVFTSCGAGPGLRTCHDRAPFQGGLDLTEEHAYAMLVNAPAAMGGVRVKPGSPDESALWRKLTDDLADDGSEGEPMPAGEAIQWQPLPAEQLDLVEAWIEAGAPR